MISNDEQVLKCMGFRCSLFIDKAGHIWFLPASSS